MPSTHPSAAALRGEWKRDLEKLKQRVTQGGVDPRNDMPRRIARIEESLAAADHLEGPMMADQLDELSQDIGSYDEPTSIRINAWREQFQVISGRVEKFMPKATPEQRVELTQKRDQVQKALAIHSPSLPSDGSNGQAAPTACNAVTAETVNVAR